MTPTDKNHEVLQAMSAVAEKGGDQWRVKIYRRAAMLGQDLHVAYYEVASLSQLANAEQWLPTLAGGGPFYRLEIAHHSQNLAQYFLSYLVEGEVRPTNYEAEKSPDWRGPRNVFVPPKATAPRVPDADLPRFQSPSGPTLNGRGSAQLATPEGGSPVAVAAAAAADLRLAAMETEYQRRLVALDAERAAAKHKAELDDLERRYEERSRRDKAERDEEMAKLRRELAASNQGAAAKPADSSGMVVAITAALSPLVTAFVSSSNEFRKLQMEQQHALALESQKTQLELARRHDETMKLVFEHRSAVDPELKRILEDISNRKNDGQGQAEVVSAMAENFGRMSHTMVSLIQAAAEMRQDGATSEAESEAYKIVRTAADTVNKVIDTIGASAKSRFRVPALPPHAPQAPHAPPAHALPAPATTQAPGQAAQVAPSGAAPPAVPLHGTAAAPVVAAPPPPPTAPPAGPLTTLDRLERRIRDRNNPFDVAGEIISSIQTDPEVQRALQSANGNIFELFESRLGQKWLEEHPGNFIYANQLRTELIRQGQASGLLPKEGEDFDEDAADGPDGEPTDAAAVAGPDSNGAIPTGAVPTPPGIEVVNAAPSAPVANN